MLLQHADDGVGVFLGGCVLAVAGDGEGAVFQTLWAFSPQSDLPS